MSFTLGITTQSRQISPSTKSMDADRNDVLGGYSSLELSVLAGYQLWSASL